jgi:hypothetical protein
MKATSAEASHTHCQNGPRCFHPWASSMQRPRAIYLRLVTGWGNAAMILGL